MTETTSRAGQQLARRARRTGELVDGLWQRLLGARRSPRALGSSHHELDVPLIGRVGYYADARAGGRPIVLLHGLHAAASAYDVGPLFESFRVERSTFAPDLPGFGTSERGPNSYCPMLYAKAIKRLLMQIESSRGLAPDVIALSVSCELAARVAIEAPALVRSLVLIAPTGLEAKPRVVHARHAARIERALRFPLWAMPAYRLLTSTVGIQRFLDRTLHDSASEEAPEGYVKHAQKTSRVRGAYHAPYALAAGSLFTQDALTELYLPLRVPTMVLYDPRAKGAVDRLPSLERRNLAVHSRAVIGATGLPCGSGLADVLHAIREHHEDTRRCEEATAHA